MVFMKNSVTLFLKFTKDITRRLQNIWSSQVNAIPNDAGHAYNFFIEEKEKGEDIFVRLACK